MDYNKAEHFWDNSRNGLFDFAVEIADGEDVKIAELATKKGRTPSLFYGYKKAGILYHDMAKEYGGTAIEVWRDQLEISYWTPLGRLYVNNKITLEDAKSAMLVAMSGNYSVDKFKVEVKKTLGDWNENDEAADWKKEANYLDTHYINGVFWGWKQKDVRKVTRAARLLKGRILAASEETK